MSARTPWTKGPWAVGAIRTAADEPVVESAAANNIGRIGRRLAVVSAPLFPQKGSDDQWRAEHRDKADANARLIAASPEGFIAADAAYRLLLLLSPGSLLRIQNQQVYAALVGYIAKALGEEAETIQNRYEAEARGDSPSPSTEGGK